ncbi:MAG: hypothetical protein IMY74_06460 [Bacteroidetes bacterium]|nr:hypothetical protein [Bacteroidota bacterium]
MQSANIHMQPKQYVIVLCIYFQRQPIHVGNNTTNWNDRAIKSYKPGVKLSARLVSHSPGKRAGADQYGLTDQHRPFCKQVKTKHWQSKDGSQFRNFSGSTKHIVVKLFENGAEKYHEYMTNDYGSSEVPILNESEWRWRIENFFKE